MIEDRGILWAAHHHAVNTCKHPEINRPDPPEPIWFEKKPFKCVQCAEQIHANQVEEVAGKLRVINYAATTKTRKRSPREKIGILMNIEDANTAQDRWTAMVEQYVKLSEFAVMPCSVMSESAAFTLAKRLNISVQIRGDEYLFTASKQAARLLQNGDGARH